MSRSMRWLLISLLIMILIFFFSMDNGQASLNKSSFFLPLLEWFLPQDIAMFVIRKAAHFSIYAALGFCLYRGIYLKYPKHGPVFITICIICFAYACSDELHQFFVSGRSAQFSDVILDTWGSIFGGSFSAILLKKWG